MKKTMLLLGFGLIAPAALADTRDDVLAGIARCGAIQDNHTWLNCVYGAQQPMRALLNLPPAPDFQQRLVPSATSTQLATPRYEVPRATARAPAARRPGFFSTLVGAAPPIAVSRMTDYRFESSGAFVVTLENGQTWRQTEPDAGRVKWNKSPTAYEVSITSGVFGSYSLKLNGSAGTYKVERVTGK